MEDTERIVALIEEAPDQAAAAAVAVRELATLPGYSWVGIYWLDGDELVLGPWVGPQATEHSRIPVGVGICGAAAVSGRTEIVDDVQADDRYLACFVDTRSEIVVPILRDGRVIGEIDVDGTEVAAFGAADAAGLETVAAALAARADVR